MLSHKLLLSLLLNRLAQELDALLGEDLEFPLTDETALPQSSKLPATSFMLLLTSILEDTPAYCNLTIIALSFSAACNKYGANTGLLNSEERFSASLTYFTKVKVLASSIL